MNSSTRATRRAFVGGIGASAIVPFAAFAQQPTAATGTPSSVISNPPRQWGWRAPPNIYPDPDVIVIDPSFAALRVGNNARDEAAVAPTAVARRQFPRDPLLCGTAQSIRHRR